MSDSPIDVTISSGGLFEADVQASEKRTAYEIKLLHEINRLRLKVEHLDQQLQSYKDMDD